MNRRTAISKLSTLLVAALVGCGTPPEPRAQDAGISAGAGDTVLFAPDTGVGAGADTGADTGATDTGAADTGGPDTGAPDAGPLDTGGRSGADTTSGGDDGICPGGCDDGLPCTVDGCAQGACSHALSAGYCLSGGSCVAAGPVAGNPCLACKPEVATLSLQPVVGAACDDGVDCTTGDVCDAKGACTGTPKGSCCTKDLDCVSGAPCVQATCNVATGQCETSAKVGCCQQGVCCDPTTFAPRLAGTKCGTSPVSTEWACDGASVRRRDAFAGCDGSQPGACSAAPKDWSWTPWTTVSTCGQGQACVLKDKASQPTCGAAPQCTSDAQCNDGKICTKDLCQQGKCTHPPENKGVPCGGKAIATEYRCSTANKGGAIEVRYAVSTCDGAASVCPETTATPVWGKWQTFKTCGYAEVCKVSDPKQPGVCTGAPKCQPGTTCCTAGGDYAAKAMACGTKVVDSEAKCEPGPDGTAKGGKLLVREALPGCSGGSTSCYSYVSSYLAWGPWKSAKQCGAKETCTVNYSGTQGSCDKKTQCTAGGTCCDSDGFYAPKGTQCGTSAWKTEQRCSGPGKGATIEQREAWRGCSGTSTYCSSLAENLVWGQWKAVKTCPATQLCEVSYGKASCASACQPSQSCCTASGEFEKAGTKCGSWSVKSESKCEAGSGPGGKGAKIVEREAWYGCSGASASCSYDKAWYAWGPWATKTQCKAWQGCEIKYGSPSCTSTCDPSDACCSELGEYAKKGTACSTFVSSSETKCSGPGAGGAILVREAVRGCSGADAFCSYSSANYVWGEWKTKTQCKADQYCKGTYSHYCSSTPP